MTLDNALRSIMIYSSAFDQQRVLFNQKSSAFRDEIGYVNVVVKTEKAFFRADGDARRESKIGVKVKLENY